MSNISNYGLKVQVKDKKVKVYSVSGYDIEAATEQFQEQVDEHGIKDGTYIVLDFDSFGNYLHENPDKQINPEYSIESDDLETESNWIRM